MMRLRERRSVFSRLLSIGLPVTMLLMVFGVVSAPPASAHSAPNSPSSNYVSAITDVTPAASTFRIRTIEATSRLELRWLSGAVIQVADYDGFPYLRVGPDGVEENQQSYAVYLNKDRQRCDRGARQFEAGRSPGMEEGLSEPVARWHDHRAHWMGGVKPDGVLAQPDQRQVVQPFTFTVTQADTTYTIAGTLEWVPGSSPVPFLLLGAALALAIVAAAVWAGMNDDRRMRVRLMIAAVAIGLLVVDAAHLVGIAFGVKGPTGDAVGRMFSIGFVSIVAWVVLAVGAILVLRKRFDAYYLLVLGAGLVTVIGGVSDFSVLSRSNAPVAFSMGLLRTIVALTLGLGVGLVVACVLLTRRGLPAGGSGPANDATDLESQSDSSSVSPVAPVSSDGSVASSGSSSI